MSQLTGNPSLPLPCARKTKWGSLICIPLRFPLQGRLFPLFQTELGGGQKQERGNQPIFPPEKLIGEKRRMQKKEMKKKKQCKKVFSKPLQTPIACSILYVSISRLCIHSSYYRLLLNMPQNIVHFLLSSVEKKGGGRRKWVPNPCQIWGLLSMYCLLLCSFSQHHNFVKRPSPHSRQLSINARRSTPYISMGLRAWGGVTVHKGFKKFVRY